MFTTTTLATKKSALRIEQSVNYETAPIQIDNANQTLRQHQRIATNLRAILYCRAQFQTTRIHDLSQGGAGLTGAFGVMPNDDVKLQLLDGRELCATVRWWVKGRCGLVFKQSLESDDPLLHKAKRRSLVTNHVADTTNHWHN